MLSIVEHSWELLGEDPTLLGDGTKLIVCGTDSKMEMKIQGKTITVPASKLDEIRAAYSDTEHISLTEPRIHVVLRKKDAAETPTQATEQERVQ